METRFLVKFVCVELLEVTVCAVDDAAVVMVGNEEETGAGRDIEGKVGTPWD